MAAVLDAKAINTKKKENPFEVRSNHRLRHAALNRKVKGAVRNVGQARSKAKETREKQLLRELKDSKSASIILDKRFGENDQKLTHEEKMLRRFQKVRSKRRAGRFHLGDDATNQDGNDEEQDLLTHGGKRIVDIMQDDEDFVQQDDDDENLGDDDDVFEDGQEDVSELIQRLKSGETLSSMNSKAPLTKREAMIDVMKKSKLLKMERQRIKEDDEDERDRVDALMKDVIMAGNLSFRPTGPDKEPRAANNDAFERTVRELQTDRGPRAQATERTKTAEEIAQDELEELQRKEAERIRRMDNDYSEQEDDDEKDDEDDEDDDDDGNKHHKRTKKRRKTVSKSIPDDEALDDSDDLTVPFIIDCFRSHAELLEFIQLHPGSNLDVILIRVEKSTSIHLAAGNRDKLGKLAHVLMDHLQLCGEKSIQLNDGSARKDIDILIKHMRFLAAIAAGEVTALFLARLDHIRRTLDSHLLNSLQAPLMRGGDYGLLTSQTNLGTVETKPPGGHKDGLHIALNEQAAHLSKLRGDAELVSSSTRCWPSPGDFAFYFCALQLYSTTDFRHPVCTPAVLLLARTLMECPIRGPRDVVASLQVAELLQLFIENDTKRFAPEIFLYIRIVLTQMRLHKQHANNTTRHDKSPRVLHQLNASHVAFRFLSEESRSTSVETPYFYVSSNEDFERAYGGKTFLHAFMQLMERAISSVDSREIPSTDVLLLDSIVELASEREDMQALVDRANDIISEKIQSNRIPLRLQSFQPVEESLAPRFLADAISAQQQRPGQVQRNLKKEMKRQEKGMARELRLDSQFVEEAKRKERTKKLDSLRATRQRNFAELEGQQATFNKLVKIGVAVKGAGVGGLKMQGRRMGKKQL